MSKNVRIKIENKSVEYAIEINHDHLKSSGDWARKSLIQNTNKVAVISNRKVFALYGKTVEKSLRQSGFEVLTHLIGDGERYKNFNVLQRTLKFFSENKLSRTDCALALGGGVVGDLTGFAASIYLRGISFLQIPTTLLAMIDSSVGGKTGINTGFGKNLLGTFYQPSGVLIDPEVLQTLPVREITAGLCEAVKQGAIASQNLFEQTSDFLMKNPVRLIKKQFSDSIFRDELANLLAAQIAFKAEIVRGDEQEDACRTDARSRKILNFGHTSAHALEKITDYKYFRHGEAVGYGILIAGEISKRVANFSQHDLKSLNDVVNMTGVLPETDKIETEKVIQAFAFDKKQIGKSLQWILLESIGNPKIVQSREIPIRVIKTSLEKVLKAK